MKLKSPTELLDLIPQDDRQNIEKYHPFLQYIDEIHNALMSYQIAIDVAVSKNMDHHR